MKVTENIQMYNGDCLELYKYIEPKSIDLILTDLPYGTTACKWDTIIPFVKLWEMVNYLLKPNAAFITTASQPFTSALIMSNPKMFKYELIWDKTFSSNPFLLPCRIHENILVFYEKKGAYNPIYSDRPINEQRPNSRGIGKVKINTYNDNVFGNTTKGHSDKFDDKKVSPKSIIKIHKHPANLGLHPTQKPIALFEYLLKTYSNKGMTIFDPCMGSGTTGVACKNTNRNFIGIEMDENYFNIAEKRIQNHVSQQKLF